MNVKMSSRLESLHRERIHVVRVRFARVLSSCQKLGANGELNATKRCDSTNLKKYALTINKEFKNAIYRDFPYIIIGICAGTMSKDCPIAISRNCEITINTVQSSRARNVRSL